MRILSVKQMKQLINNTPEGGIIFYEVGYEAVKDSYGEIQWKINAYGTDSPDLMVTNGVFGATNLIPESDGFPSYNLSKWDEMDLIDGLNPIENKDSECYNQSELFDFDWNINEYIDYDDEEYTQGKINIMPGETTNMFVVLNKNEIKMMIDLLNKALKVEGCDLDD